MSETLTWRQRYIYRLICIVEVMAWPHQVNQTVRNPEWRAELKDIIRGV